jgi:hypothetical protein
LDGRTEGLKAGLINPVAVLRTNIETHPLLLTEASFGTDAARALLGMRANVLSIRRVRSRPVSADRRMLPPTLAARRPLQAPG